MIIAEIIDIEITSIANVLLDTDLPVGFDFISKYLTII
jgi:hypothetical protein